MRILEGGELAGAGGADGLVLVKSAGSLAACEAMCRLAGNCRGVEYSATSAWCQLWDRTVVGSRPEAGHECLSFGEAGEGDQWEEPSGGASVHGAGSDSENGLVSMAPCDAADEAQQWYYDGAAWRVRSWSGLCLEVDALRTDRSPVRTAPCLPEGERQSFEYDAAMGELRTKTVDADGSRWCLETPQGVVDGGRVQLSACLVSDAMQAWSVGDAPWVSQEAVLQPGLGRTLPRACSNRFMAPPPPTQATDYNGLALEDACFNWTNEENRSNHVFIIGDWGGILKNTNAGGAGRSPQLQPADSRSPTFPDKQRQFVVGVDDWAQLRVAEQMRTRAVASQPDYVLNVGDNFYWGGIGTDGDYGAGRDVSCGAAALLMQCPVSGQWHQIFESIYWGDGLDGKQWLGVLGNHDYGGYKFTAAWDQVIAYTWVQPEAGKPQRWMTPAQYYSARVWYSDFSVDYFFLDTNVVDAQAPEIAPGHNICNRMHNPAGASCGPTGPSSAEACKGWFDALWEEEFAWLERGLAASEAEWQIVVTHFPADALTGNWTYLAKKHGIDVIIAGHQHMQLVRYLEGNFLDATAHVVSGGGGGITSDGVPSLTGDDDQYGFMDMTLTRHELTIEAISHGGRLRGTTRVRQRLPAAVLEAQQKLDEAFRAKAPGEPSAAAEVWATNAKQEAEEAEAKAEAAFATLADSAAAEATGSHGAGAQAAAEALDSGAAAEAKAKATGLADMVAEQIPRFGAPDRRLRHVGGDAPRR